MRSKDGSCSCLALWIFCRSIQGGGMTMDFSQGDTEEGAHNDKNSKDSRKGCPQRVVPLRQQVKTIKIPRTMRNEAFLKHPDLTLGQKRYLCSIARIYSANNMRALTEKHLQSQIRCGSKKLPASGKSKHELKGHCRRDHTATSTTKVSQTVDDVCEQITCLSMK
ncbi:hypothetical protein GDO81_002378 [Engystomops pustulosus]|uniref:Protein FAM216A n=1 Tax=Engystomops pustulosus TaxID=76066 RepID=A0AAV7DNF0_ENGPU|nr:hypothetical protein GDO81_002378 [Engystomops pustulosus]